VSRWDIDPAGVRSVVSRTIDRARGFEEQARSYETALGGAVEASGSQIVGQALVDFATHNAQGFQFLVDHTARVVNGAIDATAAYLDGDLAMAGNAQRNAAS
jgi:Family of unknown function (DUF6507)